MTTMTIMRTTDNKAWLVGLDGQIISEIENEAVETLVADKPIVVETRAQAASHFSHDC
jgi:hypothetical protein